MTRRTKQISDSRILWNVPFRKEHSARAKHETNLTLMIFFHVSFSTHNMLDVNTQLKLNVNPLFEKPRRPNLNRFDVNSPYSFSLHSKSIINARTSILESPGLTNKAKRPRRQILLLNTVSELKNNFPCLKALRTVTCTQYCKNRLSFEAQYNKNIKLTIDKAEKYRTWIMREKLWSQRKTHWPKMISCGGTLTVKCQLRESNRLKWGYMREDIESSRRGESSDIQEEAGLQYCRSMFQGRSLTFVEGLSRKLERVTLVCSWKIKVPLPKQWSTHYSLANNPILESS